MKYLGENFDIHTGGEDHIPVHHTNEIAQSEAATGKKFVNYWLHGAFLTFKGEKISKSKGGLYTISELEKLGYLPLSYRYLCLSAHYRTQLDFSAENLKNAQNSYERLKNIISKIKDDKKENKSYLEEFEKAINDDLNLPAALQVLWKLVRDEKAYGKIKTIEKMDEVFGLDLLKKEKIEIPEEIKKLADEREKARKNNNWKLADELRNKIRKKGFLIDDSDSGYRIMRCCIIPKKCNNSF
jgi:cysteinyl-tRNA synthetase